MKKAALAFSFASLLGLALSAQSSLDVAAVPDSQGTVVARLQGAEPHAPYLLRIGLADGGPSFTGIELAGVVPGQGAAYLTWQLPHELLGTVLEVQGVVLGRRAAEVTNLVQLPVAPKPRGSVRLSRASAPSAVRRVFVAGAEQEALVWTGEIQHALELTEVDLVHCDASAVTPSERFSMPLRLDGVDVSLSLFPQSVRTHDFQLLIDDLAAELLGETVPPSRTYRGVVEGVTGSRVAATVIDGQVWATIDLGAGAQDLELWQVQPVSSELERRGVAVPASLHAVYRSSSVALREEWTDIALEVPDDGSDTSAALLTVCPPETFNVVEIAFDADVQFYNQNGGSVANTMADIENVVNSMNVIYERDTDVTFVIPTTLVRTMEPDPYTTSDASGLLNQFRGQWNGNHNGIGRDVAHLMTGRNLSGSTIGIAWLNVICASLGGSGLGYGLSQSNFSGNFNSRVALTAHEVGHNFAASHCNGNGDCHIMCSGLGGCNGLGGPGFGNPSANVIRNDAINSGCLGCTGLTLSVQSSFAVDIDVSPNDLFGVAQGTTPFELEYTENDTIVLTAPSLIEDAVLGLDVIFIDWEIDGIAQNSDESLTMVVSADADVRVDYAFTGTVNVSSSPAGANLTVSPADLNGIGGGTGPLDLTYLATEMVTLTAPATAGSRPFLRWVINGVPQPVGQLSVDLIVSVAPAGQAVATYRSIAPQDASGAGTGTKSVGL